MIDKVLNKFIVFSGEDYQIINKCNASTRVQFAFIGFLVFIILCFCFFSAYLFTDSLFHLPIQDFGIAIVWGAIITNMYVLLLYTISPTILPVKNKIDTYQIGYRINASLIIRLLIIIVIAVITAQPISVFLLAENAANYAATIKILISSKVEAWLITILVVACFIIPVYIKYALRNKSNFYLMKADIEKQIIKDEYNEFKTHYENILTANCNKYNSSTLNKLLYCLNKQKEIDFTVFNKIMNEINLELANEKITKYEYWADTPFRTIKKTHAHNALSQDDFLKKIYSTPVNLEAC